MKKIIHNIRQKSDHHKDRIIWITAAVVAGILLVVWAIVGSGRKTTPDENFFQSFNQELQDNQTNTSAIPLDVNSAVNANTNSNTNQ